MARIVAVEAFDSVIVGPLWGMAGGVPGVSSGQGQGVGAAFPRVGTGSIAAGGDVPTASSGHDFSPAGVVRILNLRARSRSSRPARPAALAQSARAIHS